MRKLATDQRGLNAAPGDCFRLLAVGSGRADGFCAAARCHPAGELHGGRAGRGVQDGGPSWRASKSVTTSGSRSTPSTPTSETGWSVLVRGLAEVEPDEACARLDRTAWNRGAGRPKTGMWMRIRPTSITGRRIPSPEAEDEVSAPPVRRRHFLVGGAVGLDRLQLVPAGISLDLARVAVLEQLDEVLVLGDGALGPLGQVGEHRVADPVQPLVGLLEELEQVRVGAAGHDGRVQAAVEPAELAHVALGRDLLHLGRQLADLGEVGRAQVAARPRRWPRPPGSPPRPSAAPTRWRRAVRRSRRRWAGTSPSLRPQGGGALRAPGSRSRRARGRARRCSSRAFGPNAPE